MKKERLKWAARSLIAGALGGKGDVTRFIVYVSQENRQHFMGHMILWGLKKAVMPWRSDGPVEADLGGTLETTLATGLMSATPRAAT
jgi:hypothetical protein